MKFRVYLTFALLALSLSLFFTSCEKDEKTNPDKPYIGLWLVEKDTYKENGSDLVTTYYDDPQVYYINVKSNGTWTEEESYLGEEPIVRNYQYELIGNDSLLIYTNTPADGHKIRFEVSGLSMKLFEKGYKEVQGQSIPYTYVRYLYK
ncbi:MAG TPA: hypothetical protein VFD78_02895 [Chitinophagaceae bacterium]|nr:hypothetical protein [Chitinophagaceae bacterium]